MTFFGVHLLGFDLRTGEKIVLTAGLLIFFALLRRLVAYATRARVSAAKQTAADGVAARTVFWARQVISLVLFAALVLALVSVWFDNAANVATVAGLFTAGIAFALQRVITAFAAYIVILRG